MDNVLSGQQTPHCDFVFCTLQCHDWKLLSDMKKGRVTFPHGKTPGTQLYYPACPAGFHAKLSSKPSTLPQKFRSQPLSGAVLTGGITWWFALDSAFKWLQFSSSGHLADSHHQRAGTITCFLRFCSSAPLLCYSLCGKHGDCSAGFFTHMLVAMSWLAEVSTYLTAQNPVFSSQHWWDQDSITEHFKRKEDYWSNQSIDLLFLFLFVLFLTYFIFPKDYTFGEIPSTFSVQLYQDSNKLPHSLLPWEKTTTKVKGIKTTYENN